MRFSSVLGLAATASAGHVAVPVARQRYSHPLAKRQNDDNSNDFITLEALNNLTGGGYYSEFGIGSPPQSISFQLDTGSSDTWVNSAEADLCTDREMQRQFGTCSATFDPEDSDTFEIVDRGGFDITYLDGRNIEGDYFSDTVTIGDTVIENQQLGLALQSVRGTGIMGLGFRANVASDDKYPTIVNSLVSQGYIDTPAYSLYLNDLESDAGNILFGAIDTLKFIDDLAILDLIHQEGSPDETVVHFNVRLEGFDVQSPEGERTIDLSDLNANAILDSGSTICLLPDDQVQDIWDEFGVIAFADVLAPFVDCGWAGERGEGYIFEFRFDGKTIQVPLAEMVVNAYEDIQDAVMEDPIISSLFEDWDGFCIFGIGSTADFGINDPEFTLLGDTFLRSAYVVYDLANEQLGIAQANLNSTESNIVEIKEGDLPTNLSGVDEQGDSTNNNDENNDDNNDDNDNNDNNNNNDDNNSDDNSNNNDESNDEDDNGGEGAAGRLMPSTFGLATLMTVVGAVMAAL